MGNGQGYVPIVARSNIPGFVRIAHTFSYNAYHKKFCEDRIRNCDQCQDCVMYFDCAPRRPQVAAAAVVVVAVVVKSAMPQMKARSITSASTKKHSQRQSTQQQKRRRQRKQQQSTNSIKKPTLTWLQLVGLLKEFEQLR